MIKNLKSQFKKLIAAAMLASLMLSGSTLTPASAVGPNYAKSTEVMQIAYRGYIQFKPNYKTTRSSGYGLKSGKHVRQAYINYTRNGRTVIGGRKYTQNVRRGNRIVSTTATAYDDIRWGDRYTTRFHYGWFYR